MEFERVHPCKIEYSNECLLGILEQKDFIFTKKELDLLLSLNLKVKLFGQMHLVSENYAFDERVIN